MYGAEREKLGKARLDKYKGVGASRRAILCDVLTYASRQFQSHHYCRQFFNLSQKKRPKRERSRGKEVKKVGYSENRKR